MPTSKEPDSLDSKFYKSADAFFLTYNSIGLTYDDVTLATLYSEVLPRDTQLDTTLGEGLSLNIPVISSDMDTVTESRMAIAMALNGGLGIIHYNMAEREQLSEVSRVKNNVHHEISRTPKPLLAAIAKSKDYRFDSGEIFHFKRPTPIGVSDSGWGFPAILWHFDDLYQIQVYRRTDQVIALDYMHPFRVVTPQGQSGANGPMQFVQGQEFRAQVSRMFAEQRLDRTKIHGLGVPVDLHNLGGEGKNMILADVIKVYTDMFLDGMGLPAEIYHGTLAVNASPIALKIMSRQFNWMFEGLSNLTNFIAQGLQSVMGGNQVKVFLKTPSTAYSDEVMKMKMQLAANSEISRKEVYPDMDIADPVAARVERILEDQEIQRKSQERGKSFDREMQQGSMADVVAQKMQQGPQGQQGAPQGGAPQGAPQGGGLDYSKSPSDDPSSVKQRAADLAAQWDQMPEGARRKEMMNCRAVNDGLYSMAMTAIKDLRASRVSQANQQSGGGQPH